MEDFIDDIMGNIAAIINKRRDEIASLRAELAAKDACIGELDSALLLSYMDDWAEETIVSLRAELTETRAKFDDYLLDYKAVHEIGAMRDLRAELADVKEQLHYANGTCDLAMKHRETAEAGARQERRDAREAASRFARGSVAVQHGAFIGPDDLEAERKRSQYTFP